MANGKPAVGDELEAGGTSFGRLIESTGTAIAETQSELDASSAESVSELAETLVDVIVVEERVFDSSGTQTDGKTHTRELPATLLFEQTFHAIEEARVQGQLFVEEVSGTGSLSIQSKSRSVAGEASGGFSLRRGFGVRGSASGAGSATTTRVDASFSSDRSIGKLRCYATWRAREDVALPKPDQVIDGPRLDIKLGAKVTEPPERSEEAPITGHAIDVTVELSRTTEKQDGVTYIDGKTVSVEAPGLLVESKEPPEGSDSDRGFETKNGGKVELTLRRTFDVDPDAPSTTPDEEDFVVTARLGLISANAVVSL